MLNILKFCACAILTKINESEIAVTEVKVCNLEKNVYVKLFSWSELVSRTENTMKIQL